MATIYTPGMEIGNETNSDGALGCFAQSVGHPEIRVLLSNAHVLFGDALGSTGLKIYQPAPTSTCCRGTPIADTLNSWQAGFKQATVKVTTGGATSTQTGSETDCAIARLRPATQYQNNVPGIGMISGKPAAGNLGVVAGPPDGTAPTNDQYVRMYSPVDKQVRYGTIIKPAGSSATYDGGGPVPDLLYPFPISDDKDDPVSGASVNINQLLILPRIPPGENANAWIQRGVRLSFAKHGDSGSVIVNSQNQVIGLLCRQLNSEILKLDRSKDEYRLVDFVGIVNPIQKVLDALGIDIPANFAGTVPAHAQADRFYLGGLEPDPAELALRRGTERMRDKLMAVRKGRLMLGMIDRHRKEARALVTGVRHVNAVWTQNEGPAFVAHLLQSLRDPARMIPTQINGVGRTQLLSAMAAMFLRFGSERLRRDIERYWQPVFERFTSVGQLNDLPALLEKAKLAPVHKSA